MANPFPYESFQWLWYEYWIPVAAAGVAIFALTSIWGTTSNALIAKEEPSTQYMTRLAPILSDIHPPSARITPEGKLNAAARKPAITRPMPYPSTKYVISHWEKATKQPKTKK